MAFKNSHKRWLYRKNGTGGQIFEKDAIIPEGWYDSKKGHWDNMPPEIEEKVKEPAPFKEPEEVKEPEPEEEEGDLVCSECGKRYQDEYWYSRHLKSKHGIE